MLLRRNRLRYLGCLFIVRTHMPNSSLLRSPCFMFIAIYISAGMTSCTESNYAHCVIVKNEQQFNGKKLRSVGPKESSTKTKEACALKDKEIDKSDGPDKGRVRWVNCSIGPDCGEAGEI